MRIAVISPGYPDPGSSAFEFVRTRVREYTSKKRGAHQVRVFVPRSGGLGCDFDEDSCAGVVKGFKAYVSGSIRAFKPDVLACHYPTLAVMDLAEQLPDVPRVVWLHGHDVLWSWEVNARSGLDEIRKRLCSIPRQIITQERLAEFLGESAKVVCVSNWLRDQIHKDPVTRPGNVTVIPNPIDTDRFQPLHAGGPYWVGGDPVKLPPLGCVTVKQANNRHGGLDIAIRAFSEPNMPDHLWIYTHGRHAMRLARQARRHFDSPVAVIPGITPNHKLPAIFNRHLAYVAPSRFETQGVSMCEAMACGLPVIGFQTGGIPEVVANGVEGLLVRRNRYGQAQDLAEAVRLVYSDPALMRRMGQRARTRIVSHFSCDQIIPQELAILARSCRMEQGAEATSCSAEGR